MPRQQQNKTTYDVDPKGRAPFNMDALVEGGPEIEVVSGDADIRKISEDAAFMNEMVDIRFLDNGDPNAPRMVEIGVNTLGAQGMGGGKSDFKGFMRGKWYQVRRYMVEAVAHAKYVNLKQVPNPNPANPEMMNVEQVSFCYPFEVRDRNPLGRAWLDARMNDPA